MASSVKAWREAITIPTYEVGAPEKAPIFLEKRVYQGSSGVVYPYPVIESISDTKTDHTYNAVWIENEYIKVMILPELGGRVQMAYDKIKERHFVYYNHVVKPALVGLAGPWISGGIEFNWPQHHRPSTYMPVDCQIEENADGSVTIWVNEMERMTHQKGMAGFTLRPGCAYLEIQGRVSNPTDVPQTFLWWANPAVAVNDHYQSVFPPDINAVFDHGKRAVSSFPIATGEYYKMDYSAGVDISNYKNIKVPTSYMGVNSQFNFEGGYENDTQAGMLHVANHHYSPGKKQWTWGNGDFGRAWDRNLTDNDGPYIELMAGVYTENQPDFSWLMPYEEKRFVQYFMPYRELGIVKNANKDLIFNIEQDKESKSTTIKIFATSKQQIRLAVEGYAGSLCSEELTVSPEKVFVKKLDNVVFADILGVEIIKGKKVVLSWTEPDDSPRPIPSAAEAALQPEEIKTCEQLYLTGLHLEQYRHATFSAKDYYEEALRRDPMDVRNNNAMGLWYMRRAKFNEAEPYFRKAVKVLQKRNPNPYDGEAIYNLGICLKYMGEYAEAYDWLYKATWNAAWQSAAFLGCAQISCMMGEWENALEEIEKSIVMNWHNHKSRALKAAILRNMGAAKEVSENFIAESLKADLFNYGCMFEQYKLGNAEAKNKLTTLLRGDYHNYDEVALQYAAAGLWNEALEIWGIAEEQKSVSAMTYYYRAWAKSELGEEFESELKKAEATSADYCFPNRLEAAQALTLAVGYNCAQANYLLGCLYYDKRQYREALDNWETSAQLKPEFALVHRNIALAYMNKFNKVEEAVEEMEKAYGLNTSDARILMELDQLYKRLNYSHADRLAKLEQHKDVVMKRDDLILEYITLLNLTGEMEKAKALLDSHIFHPWEGGEGKVPAQYQFARVQLAAQNIAEGNYAAAEKQLLECLEYPHHLGEGKLHGAQENDFYYLLALAATRSGKNAEAKEYLAKAMAGKAEPAAAMYYNDQKPEKIFYQGMAHKLAGDIDGANKLFNKLVTYGTNHLFDEVKMDYFAVSLPDLLIWDDSLQAKNELHCRFMLALGYYGLGERDKCDCMLDEIDDAGYNHLGLIQFTNYIEMVENMQ